MSSLAGAGRRTGGPLRWVLLTLASLLIIGCGDTIVQPPDITVVVEGDGSPFDPCLYEFVGVHRQQNGVLDTNLLDRFRVTLGWFCVKWINQEVRDQFGNIIINNTVAEWWRCTRPIPAC